MCVYIYIYTYLCLYIVLRIVAQSFLTLWDPMEYSPPGSSVHGASPNENTGAGCHALLQEIFPNQGSNPVLPHCKHILYRLSHQGVPYIYIAIYRSICESPLLSTILGTLDGCKKYILRQMLHLICSRRIETFLYNPKTIQCLKSHVRGKTLSKLGHFLLGRIG